MSRGLRFFLDLSWITGKRGSALHIQFSVQVLSAFWQCALAKRSPPARLKGIHFFSISSHHDYYKFWPRYLHVLYS